METETLRSKRARRASKVATAAAKHKAISFQPERSEDTAQIDDVELETNSNVQSAQPSQGGYATVLSYVSNIQRKSFFFSKVQ